MSQARDELAKLEGLTTRTEHGTTTHDSAVKDLYRANVARRHDEAADADSAWRWTSYRPKAETLEQRSHSPRSVHWRYANSTGHGQRTSRVVDKWCQPAFR